MKRTLFDLLLVIALGAAAAFGWMRYQAGAGVAAQVAELAPQTAGAITKLAESEKALQELQDELAPLREQAEQLIVYRSAFANGEALRDLEAAYKKVIDACRKHKKHPGMGGVVDHALMDKYINMGMRFILSGSDLSFILAGGRARTSFLNACNL